MADIVHFTNQRKQDMAIDRGFFDYIIVQIQDILGKIDENKEDLTPYWNKLHTITKGLWVMSYEYERYFEVKCKLDESNTKGY